MIMTAMFVVMIMINMTIMIMMMILVDLEATFDHDENDDFACNDNEMYDDDFDDDQKDDLEKMWKHEQQSWVEGAGGAFQA